MELLATWLLCVALADLVRGSHDEVTTVRSWLAGLVGTAGGAGSLGILGVEGWSLVGWVAAAAGLLAVWIHASSQALHKVTWTYPAIAALAVPAVVALGLSGQVDLEARGWFRDWYQGLEVASLDRVSVGDFVTGLAVVLFLINTCNVLVRVVLRGANAPAAKAER